MRFTMLINSKLITCKKIPLSLHGVKPFLLLRAGAQEQFLNPYFLLSFKLFEKLIFGPSLMICLNTQLPLARKMIHKF